MNKKINIEQLFLSSLGSVDKLRWYLSNQIDVVKYIYQTSPGYMALVDTAFLFIPKPKRKEMLKDFTVDRILGLLKRQRPDLYNILISHHDGRRWLEEQIVNFRKKFL